MNKKNQGKKCKANLPSHDVSTSTTLESKPKKGLPSWDLSDLYSGIDDPKIEADIAEIEVLVAELTQYREKMKYMQPNQMFKFIKSYERAILKVRRLSSFAYLNADTQQTNSAATSFQQDLLERLADVFDGMEFVSFEISNLPEVKMEEFIQYPKLQKYLLWLVRVYDSEYALTEDDARIIGKQSVISEGWERLYDEVTARLVFKLGGKKYNMAEISNIANTDPNPKRREAAIREQNRVFKANSHLLCFNFNMLLKAKQVDDDLWGAAESSQGSRQDNRITKEDLLLLANEVTDTYVPVVHRFYALKAKLSGKDCLKYSDRNDNPFPKLKNKYSWEECVNIVLNAFEEFSPEFRRIGQMFIDNKWIDVPPKQGKASGAYSMGGSGEDGHPYILLNFMGTDGDVRTLAHELGHGIHQMLSQKVGVLNDHTPAALAEIASLFAESIIFKKQLGTAKNNQEKLYLLVDRVIDMINTTHRQIAFYKFEERVHRERRKHEISEARFSQIWKEESERCIGITMGDDATHLWMGISHIFTKPFYVYSYAFAGTLVNCLFRAYEEDKTGSFAKLYTDMLSNTGIMYYRELLEPFDIGADEPDFWVNGLELITEYIDQIEELAKEEGLL